MAGRLEHPRGARSRARPPRLGTGAPGAASHLGDCERRSALRRRAAARDQRSCAILYANAGADDLEARVIHLYVLAYADGSWYLVAHCAVKEGTRVFRVDRILEAAGTDDTFEVPADFDPDDWVCEGYMRRGERDVDVRVRSSSRIPRWSANAPRSAGPMRGGSGRERRAPPPAGQPPLGRRPRAPVRTRCGGPGARGGAGSDAGSGGFGGIALPLDCWG